MKPLFYILLFFTLELNAQETSLKLRTEVLEFYNRIESLYGTVYIDTSYSKFDTTELKKYIASNDLKSALSVIQLFEMKCVNFNFRTISMNLKNIVSVDSFFKIKNVKPNYTPYEVIYNNKLDSFIQSINSKTGNRDSLPNYIKKAEDLLIKSSYWTKSSETSMLSKNKLLRIVSIFESKDYFLFVYTISELFSTLHTYPKYELIIK